MDYLIPIALAAILAMLANAVMILLTGVRGDQAIYLFFSPAAITLIFLLLSHHFLKRNKLKITKALAIIRYSFLPIIAFINMKLYLQGVNLSWSKDYKVLAQEVIVTITCYLSIKYLSGKENSHKDYSNSNTPPPLPNTQSV